MRSFFLVALAACVGGCFNPDLGDRPFLCAKTGDKKCPNGYVCRQQYGAEVCLKEAEATDASVIKPEKRILTDAELLPSKEGPVYLDGAVVKSSKGCNDESSEPNNTSATATPITAPGLIPDWEICYPGDVDHYSFQLNVGDKLVVKVTGFYNKNGDLDAAMLDADGFVVDASRGTGDSEQVQVQADKKGKYIVGVYGFGTAVNKYNLEVSITQ